MTLPAESDADEASSPSGDDANKDHEAGAGKALEPSQAGAEDAMAPFLAAAGERVESPVGPRSLHAKLLDYSAHAAMMVGLLGFAWTLSEHVGTRPAEQAAPAKVVAATVVPSVDPAVELRRNTEKMAADISALRLSLEALRSAVRQDKTTDQIKSLATNVEGVKTGLAATKTETNATLAQLSTKIDHIPHADAGAKMQQIVERLDKMERQIADQTVTASIAPAARSTPVALPPTKPQVTAKTTPDAPEATKKVSTSKDEPEAKKPDVIAGWFVRDVYDGVAIVESKRGAMEATPGTTIPGAGVVRSIDRHGTGWTVTTSKGLIAYMPPSREHQPREFYRGAPDDF